MKTVGKVGEVLEKSLNFTHTFLYEPCVYKGLRFNNVNILFLFAAAEIQAELEKEESRSVENVATIKHRERNYMGMLEYKKENESGLIKTLITGEIFFFII